MYFIRGKKTSLSCISSVESEGEGEGDLCTWVIFWNKFFRPLCPPRAIPFFGEDFIIEDSPPPAIAIAATAAEEEEEEDRDKDKDKEEREEDNDDER
jgi:hypothetical protein